MLPVETKEGESKWRDCAVRAVFIIFSKNLKDNMVWSVEGMTALVEKKVNCKAVALCIGALAQYLKKEMDKD